MIQAGDLVTSRSGRFTGRGEVLRVRDAGGVATAVVEPTGTGAFLQIPVADLERVEDLLSSILDGRADPPARFDLKKMAMLLEAEHRRTGLFRQMKADLLPHQVLTALRVLEGAHPNHLLADDVGLGKTVEAGLIISALQARGEATRILIITPAGLTVQWQEQLEELFGTYFDVFGRDFSDVRKDAFERHPRVIASIDAVKRQNRRSVLEGVSGWDLLIVDEAHKLTARRDAFGYEERTQNFELVARIRDKCKRIVFASGTPHQGDNDRFALLLSLLRPDLYEDALSLEANRGQLATVITRNRKSEVTDEDGRFLFQDPRTIPVDVSLSGTESRFLGELEDYIRTTYGRAGSWDQATTRVVGFVLSTFGKLAASSPRAIRRALERRLARLQGDARTTKQAPGPERESDQRFEGEEEERQAPERAGSMLFFDDEVDVLQGLVSLVRSLGDGTKAEEFLRRLRQIKSEPDFRGGVLIFTEYRATQEMLVELLSAAFPGESVAVINGGQSLGEKRVSVRILEQKGGFLVSTEAGGEGLNLHRNCHVMFNYDLPWNPMRLMQRIGRLARYGQPRQVLVFNLHNRGSKDDLVRTYLEQKIDAVMTAMSAVQEHPDDLRAAILGEVDNEVDLTGVYLRSLVAADPVARSREEIDRAMGRVRKAAERMADLFASLGKFDLAEYRQARAAAGSAEIAKFARAFLKEHGRRPTEVAPGVYSFLTPEAVPKDRAIKERYERAVFDPELAKRTPDGELVAFGHPLFDRFIAISKSAELGGYVTRRRVRGGVDAVTRGIELHFALSVQASGRRKERFLVLFVDEGGAIREDIGGALTTAPSTGDLEALPSYVTRGYLESASASAQARAEEVLAEMRSGDAEEVADCQLVALAIVQVDPD